MVCYYKIIAVNKGIQTQFVVQANDMLEAESIVLGSVPDAIIQRCICYGRLLPEGERPDNIIKVDFHNRRRI